MKKTSPPHKRRIGMWNNVKKMLAAQQQEMPSNYSKSAKKNKDIIAEVKNL